MKKTWCIPALVLVALITVLAPSAALAQDMDGCDVTMFGDRGLWTLRSGYTLPQGTGAVSLYFNQWERRVTGEPNIVDPLWEDWDLEQDRLSLALGWGITDNLSVHAMLPYDSYDAFEPVFIDPVLGPLFQHGRLNGQPFVGEIDASGLGNLRVGLKYMIFGNPDSALAIHGFVDAPTGDDDEAIVTGDTGFGLGFDWTAGDFVANVEYWDPGDPDLFEVSDELFLGLGYGADISDRFKWITELTGAVMLDGNENFHDWAALATGGRVYFGDDREWTFNFGARADVSDAFDDVGFGGLLGLTYCFGGAAPPPPPAPVPEPYVPPPPPPPVTPPPPPPEPPPLPPLPPMQTTFDSCPAPVGKAKAKRWPCDESREIVYFDRDGGSLAGEQQTKLCDLVAQLRQCTELTACIAGRSASGENPDLAALRGNTVAAFLRSQGLADTRFAVSPACSAPDANGAWADIYLEE